MTKDQRWKVGGGLFAVLIVIIPLWREMSEPGQPLWNAMLFVMLSCVAVAALVLQRYLVRNIDKVGEARFDTRNGAPTDEVSS